MSADTTASAGNVRSVRVRIEGLVQGVGFRTWVERQALELGLNGWVRNRRDGGVEASFNGAADRVDEIVRRCSAGPRDAMVAMVKVLAEQEAAVAGFEVRRTV